jgi:hypothetical protein
MTDQQTPPDGKPVETPEIVADAVADNPNPEVVVDAGSQQPPADADAGERDKGEEPKPKTAAELRAERLNAIAARHKAKRDQDQGPEGDFSDPSQSYGKHAKPEFDLQPEFVKEGHEQNQHSEPAEGAKPTVPAATDKPKRFKLRVDGEEFEREIADVADLADMTVEEVEANPERAQRYAQKELAASRRLDKAKDILRGAQESKDSRRAPDQGQDGADDPDMSREQVDPDQDESLPKIIEDIQLGADPEEAAKRLETAITRSAAKVGRQVSLQEKAKDDFAHTIATYKKIKADNAELFADPYAEAVMERILHDGYREDLRGLGVSDDDIPSDPRKLVDAHRLARITGQNVRSAEKLLGDVKDKYVQYRGGNAAPANGNPSPAPRDGTARVVVDRTARRQAIPGQPAPANAPPRVPSAQPQKKSRAEVIQGMKKARGQVTA